MFRPLFTKIFVSASALVLCKGQGPMYMGRGPFANRGIGLSGTTYGAGSVKFFPRGEAMGFSGGPSGIGGGLPTPGYSRIFGPSNQFCPDGSRGHVICYSATDCAFPGQYECLQTSPRGPGVCCPISFRSEPTTCPDGSAAYGECSADSACGIGLCFQQYTSRGVCCGGGLRPGMEFGRGVGIYTGGRDVYSGSTGRFNGGMGMAREDTRDIPSRTYREMEGREPFGVSSSGGGLDYTGRRGAGTRSSPSDTALDTSACPSVTGRTCDDGNPPGMDCFAQDAVCPRGQVCCPDPCGFVCKNRVQTK